MDETESEIKRWTAKRKSQMVLDILNDKIARQHDLTPGEIERWTAEQIVVSRIAAWSAQ